MQRIITILIVLALVGHNASAQTFPSTDSLRRYIDKYVRNSAVEAFTNLRLNTALKGMLNRVDSVQAQVLGGTRVVDSIWKPNDSTFRFRIKGNIYQLTDRGGSGGGGSVTIDPVPTNGSSNAVASNGVFNALSGKANTSHNHAATDLTSGLIPSARFGSGSIPLNALAATGTLNNTTFLRGDGTFAVPPGATYSATAPLVLSGSAFYIPLATNSVSGYLSNTDRTAFAAKLSPSDTASLSNRISRAVYRFVSLNDSTMASLNEAGVIIDTLQFSGPMGGSSGGGGGSGSVTSVSAGSLAPLFSTLVTNSNTTPNIAFSLTNAGPYTLFGRGAGTGAPSYVTLDSNYIAGFHTEAYYNTKYGAAATSVPWANITGKPTTLSGYGITDAQPLDADLTQIAGISPANDDIIQRKAGAWTNRTMAQLKADLGLTKSDVGLANVDNTSDANKPVSGPQQTALNAKQPTLVSGSNIKTINGQTILGSGDLTIAGGGGGVSQAQVSQIVSDSLNANPFTLQNVARSGFDTVGQPVTKGFRFKGIAFNDGGNFQWNKLITDSTISLSPSVTVPLPSAHVQFVSSSTYTVDFSFGGSGAQNKRKYIYEGTSNSTWVLPTAAQWNGYEITIPNTVNYSISFNVPVYINSTTVISAGSQAIAPLGGAILTKQSGTGFWIIDTYR